MRTLLARAVASLVLALAFAGPAFAQDPSFPDLGSDGISPDPSSPDPSLPPPECEDGVLSIGDAIVREGDGVARLPVRLTSDADFICEPGVSYRTTPGSAAEGVDYTPASGDVDFENATIEVPITDDGLHEGDETFDVILENPDSAEIGDGVGTVTVIDDEPPPVLSVTGGEVVERGLAAFTLRLSGPRAATGCARSTTSV